MRSSWSRCRLGGLVIPRLLVVGLAAAVAPSLGVVPCKCSPVLIVGDFWFLVEVKDFAGVYVDAVDKLLEGLEVEAFFFEKCDDHLSLISVGMKHTWREWGGGIESDMWLVVEEIQKGAVDFRKLFPSVEGQDIVCRVRGLYYSCPRSLCFHS